MHGNAKTIKKSTPAPLSKDVPLLGPRFTSPRYLHATKRQYTALINPDVQYLRPVTIIHPVYYEDIARCPTCKSADVTWDSWNATGPCEVHGVSEEGTAIVYQLRCTSCHSRSKKLAVEGANLQYCFVSTSAEFWAQYKHWEIPYVILLLPSVLQAYRYN